MKNGSISFNVDLSEIVAEFSLTAGQKDSLLKKVLDDVTRLILVNWKAHAGKELKSTRREYMNSIKWIETGRLKNSLWLMGDLPNMIEMGRAPFDMKLGFAKSKKAKRTKDGKWYIHVPFRWAVPGALGENAAFANVLPQAIYDIVRGQSGTKTDLGGGKKSGGGLKSVNIPKMYAVPKTRKAVGSGKGIFGEYKHKTNIYEGMMKNTKKYQSAMQSTYTTFRTASQNSDPNSWIHSGIKAHNFAEKAFKTANINDQVDNSIDAFLSSL